MPRTSDIPVTYPGPPPAQADVVVIGGGVIGICTALYLAQSGHSVVVLEKGRVAAEQSSRNWGWVRQQGRDPHELPIMVEANRLWHAWAASSRDDMGLRQGGVTYLADDDATLGRYEAWLPHARAHGVDTQLLSPSQTDTLIPGMARRYTGALHTASDMRAEPATAMHALTRMAVSAGAAIVENCAVRCLDLAGGRVCGVVAETGRIAAPEVVVAGGAWSALFLANHGIRLPQLSVRATVAATTALPATYAGGAADRRIAFRHRIDGGYTLAAGSYRELFLGPAALWSTFEYLAQLRADPFGTRFRLRAPRGYPDGWLTARRWDADMPTPFEAMRVLDPAPNAAKVAKLHDGFARLFPGMPAFGIARAWAGMIDVMPDLVPVVDRVMAVPGLTIGTGMSGHGFGIAPAMGRVLAALVTGEKPGHDLSRFRFGRFEDGTDVDIGPVL